MHRIIFILGLITTFSTAQVKSTTEFLGNYVSHQITSDGVIIKATNAKLQLKAYRANIIRILATKDTAFANYSSPAVVIEPIDSLIKVKLDADKIVLNTDSLQIFIAKKGLKITFLNSKKEILTSEEPSLGVVWQGGKISSYRKIFPDEKIVGLGEKRGSINRRSASFINFNDANSRLLDMQHKSIPFFMSFRKDATYGIFLDTPYKSVFDFELAAENMYCFTTEDVIMNYYFFGAQGLVNILKDYQTLTGAMSLPPLWSLGYHYCRRDNLTHKDLLSITQHFRQENIPIDVIGLDVDALDSFRNFTWNSKNFPKIKDTFLELSKLKVHNTSFLMPWVKNDKEYKLLNEGISNSYFAKYPNGKNYFANLWGTEFLLPDFSRKEVGKWWSKQVEEFTEDNVSGLVLDVNEPSVFGENIPEVISFNKGMTSIRDIRNYYSLWMSQYCYEGLKMHDNKRKFLLSRSGYSGIQRYAAMWTGYNVATDEQMLSSQKLIINLGYSGIPFVGADVGGFLGDPSPELMTRWNSIAVFNPLFRNNATSKSKSREPWNYDIELKNIMKKDIETRYKLIPYIYNTFYQAQEKGLPIVRGLAFYYPTDEMIFNTEYQNQFLFGDAFLVAPVESSKDKIKVYFPEGDWYRFSSDEYFEGPKEIEVSAPLNDLPVFVKGSSIVTMQSVVQSTAEIPTDILQIHVWNGTENKELVYYEDDGETYDYENNVFYRRKIRYDGERRLLFLDPSEGKYPSKFSKFQIVLHGFKSQIMQIKLNGVNQPMKVDARNNVTSVIISNMEKQLIVGF